MFLASLRKFITSGKKPAVKARSKRFSPRVESLESRDLMAGNITATAPGGLLTLVGDVNSNQVQITRLPNGSIQVQGLGTTVNGSYAPQNFVAPPGGFTGLNANFQAGNDVLVAVNTIFGANGVNIDTAAGIDAVTLVNLQTSGNVTVNNSAAFGADASVDSVVISNSRIGGGVLISTAGGNDSVTVAATQVAGAVQIGTTDGGASSDIDTVVLNQDRIGGILAITTGRGIDVVQLLNSTVVGAVGVDTGDGNDVASFVNDSVGQLGLTMGTGNDVATISVVTSATSIDANMGDGDDILTLVSSRAATANLIGGNGRDRLIRGNNTIPVQNIGLTWEQLIGS